MDQFESRFERDLMRLVKEMRADKAAHLSSGRAQTIEEYRETVGFIRALDKVAEWAADLRESIYGTRSAD